VNKPRVTVVTAGHPSTCPRMVKAADAAVEAGYDVRFVSVDYIEWAAPLDRDVVRRRRWRWTPVSLSRAEHPILSKSVSARQRVARAMSAVLDVERTPSACVSRAYARTHPELLDAILSEPFDFVLGGTVGALGAVAAAARQAGKPFALDFEDFHPAESEDADAELTHALATRVIGDAIDGAAFTTAASAPMAQAYEQRFGVRPLVIHNVVARPTALPRRDDVDRALRLYWFSQVIGPKRGLDDIVRAVGTAGIPAELHLRGVERLDYIAQLRELARRERADLRISIHAPGVPDEMVDLAASFDVGLSPEQEGVLNRALCLPNKPLTYLAASLAVIATNTPGQRTMNDAAGDAICWYRPGAIDQLASALQRWHTDRAALARARRAAFEAALRRYHWEHPLERGALMTAMRQALA
jgi:glycosyltransferase involved in cell wall biosynthesis